MLIFQNPRFTFWTVFLCKMTISLWGKTYQRIPPKTLRGAVQRVLSRVRASISHEKNVIPYGGKVLVVWGGIFGPDFCTIHRFRLIPILYQGKSSKTLYKSRPTCPKPGPGPLPPEKKSGGPPEQGFGGPG